MCFRMLPELSVAGVRSKQEVDSKLNASNGHAYTNVCTHAHAGGQTTRKHNDPSPGYRGQRHAEKVTGNQNIPA